MTDSLSTAKQYQVVFWTISPIKPRRATKAEMTEGKEALLGLFAEMHPMTVRQIFYQATV